MLTIESILKVNFIEDIDTFIANTRSVSANVSGLCKSNITKFLPPGKQFRIGNNRSCFLSNDDELYHNLNIVTDLFSELPRLNSRFGSNPTPVEYFNQHKQQLLDEATKIVHDTNIKNEKYKNILKTAELILGDKTSDTDLLTRFIVRELLYHYSKECNNFSVSSICKLYRRWKLEGCTILDPSAGWGDRAIAASLCNAKSYTGFDPNTSLAAAYESITNYYSTNNIHFIQDSFLNAEKYLPEKESFDAVFTSPPFWTVEMYCNEPTQSVFNNGNIMSLDEWLNVFLFPYIQLAVSYLVKGGLFMLFISDTKEVKFVESTVRYMESIGLKHIGTIGKIANKYVAYPIWIYKK